MGTVRRLLRSRDLAVAAGLSIVTLWIFRDIVVRGHILWGSDFISTYLPYKQFLYEQIQRHKSIPLWNPYLFSGMPFWAFFESTIFYPLHLLFWFISPERAYGYTMAFHILLAGFSMYALCQTLHLSKTGSLLAAMIFSYNSFIMPMLFLGHMVLVQSYAWTPLPLCLFARSFQSMRPATMAIGAGVCWGLQILAADPQTAFYTYGAMALFALFHQKPLSSVKKCLNTIKALGIIFVVGVGISAIQVVPASELVSLSTRGALKTYDMVTSGSFPPQGIITLLLPNFFGNFYDDNFWVGDMPWSFPGYGLYAGILPLLLICFVRYRKGSETRLALFCVTLAIVAAVLAMGKHTPVYRLVSLLPGFDSFRAPSKIIVLWMLAISVLAGKGLDDVVSVRHEKSLLKWIGLITVVGLSLGLDLWFFLRPAETLNFFSCFLMKPTVSDGLVHASKIIQGEFHRMTIFVTVGVALLFLGSRGFMQRKTWLVLSVLIVLVDLGVFSYSHVLSSDTSYANLRAIKARLSHTFKEDREVFRVGGVRSHFGPNAEMYYGLQSTTGAGPLTLHRYYLYCDQFYSKVSSPGWQVLWYGVPGSAKFMDMLNVKYEIDYGEKVFSLRKNYLPRVLLVPNFHVLPTSRALAYMESDDFDPWTTVLLEDNPERGMSFNRNSEAADKRIGDCEILRYRPDEVLIRTTSKQDSFLVLNDIYYPGWQCYVDGIPQEILRCNYLFRAVSLEKGSHEVRFFFEPPLVKVGIAITSVTLLLSLVALIRSNKPSKR